MAVSSWCLLAAVLLFLGALLWRFQTSVRWFIFYMTTDIPGPTLWQLYTVILKRIIADDFVGVMADLSELNGLKPWGTWVNGEYFVVISDWASMTEVMKSKHTNDKPDFIYGNLAKFANGLLSLNGDDYKRHRKLISWAFRKDLLEAHLPRVNEEAEKLFSILEATKGETVEMAVIPYVNAAAISLSMFCSGTYTFPGNLSEFVNIFKTATNLVYQQSMFPWFSWFRRSYWKAEEACHVHINKVRTLFVDAREDANVYGEAGERPANLFQVMSEKNREESEDRFTEEEFFQETVTLIVAAFETTGSTECACMYFLALNPDVQNRVYAEIKAIFGESDRRAEAQDLSNMVYLEKVIKETLRIIPPGALLARRARESISLNGVEAPKGSMIVMNIWSLHRNPEFFSDPLKFDPERFSQENCASRPQFAYAPFSGGLRQCPGQVQSFIVVKTVLSYILRNFEILPGKGLQDVEDFKVNFHITIEFPKLPLRFVRRR